MTPTDLTGFLAYSLKGRDQGRPFVILEKVGDRYVRLVDGDLRRVESPKKKNLSHLRVTAIRSEAIAEALARGEPLDNHKVRKVVKELVSMYEEDREGGSHDG